MLCPIKVKSKIITLFLIKTGETGDIHLLFTVHTHFICYICGVDLKASLWTAYSTQHPLLGLFHKLSFSSQNNVKLY